MRLSWKSPSASSGERHDHREVARSARHYRKLGTSASQIFFVIVDHAPASALTAANVFARSSVSWCRTSSSCPRASQWLTPSSHERVPLRIVLFVLSVAFLGACTQTASPTWCDWPGSYLRSWPFFYLQRNCSQACILFQDGKDQIAYSNHNIQKSVSVPAHLMQATTLRQFFQDILHGRLASCHPCNQTWHAQVSTAPFTLQVQRRCMFVNFLHTSDRPNPPHFPSPITYCNCHKVPQPNAIWLRLFRYCDLEAPLLSRSRTPLPCKHVSQLTLFLTNALVFTFFLYGVTYRIEPASTRAHRHVLFC